MIDMKNEYLKYGDIVVYQGKGNVETSLVETHNRLKVEKTKPLQGIYSKSKQQVLELGQDDAYKTRKNPDENWGFLKPIKDQIEEEQQNLLRLTDEFYRSEIKGSYTPADIDRINLHLEVRMKNLMLVLRSTKEKFYGRTVGRKTVFLRKENIEREYEYDMTKIYWFDESGRKMRTKNKNFGSTDQFDFLEQFKDYFYNNIEGIEIEGLNMREELKDIPFNYIPDMIVKLNGETWLVEYENNKDNFIEVGVMLELWEHYKKTYLS